MNEIDRIPISKNTKHYYIGSERVASALGTVKDLGMLCEQSGFPELALIIRMNEKVDNAGGVLAATYAAFGKDFVLQQPFHYDDQVLLGCDHHDPNLYAAFWYHPDHLGSSSYITNLGGEINQHLEYLPFGELLVEEHLSSYNSPFKFNAKEFDAETRNYYYGARYYDPKFSIWLSVDPLAEKFSGWSPYNYTYNNPVRWTDSTGMCPDGDCPDDPPTKTAIDPGHGIRGSNNSAMDPGAVANGYKESDLALSISESVNTYLQSYGEETTMIRDGELTVEGNSLVYRTNKAKEQGADLFISIHIDAAANENASGFSVLYKDGGSHKDQNKALAQSISDNQTVMSVRGNGTIARNDLSVLNRFSSTGPAVLIEAGFITNKSDATLMSTRANNIGRDIAKGIYIYLTGSPPSSPPVDSSLRGRN